MNLTKGNITHVWHGLQVNPIILYLSAENFSNGERGGMRAPQPPTRAGM